VAKQNKVLLVGARDSVRANIAAFLKTHDVLIDEHSSLDHILNAIDRTKKYALLIADLDDSQPNKLEYLRQIRNLNHHMDICILGLDNRPDLALSLLKDGTIDHLGNASSKAGIYAAVMNAFEKKQLLESNTVISRQLRNLRTQQNKNHKSAIDLEEIYDTTLENLMTALDIRDVETFGHSKTVAKYSQVLAGILGITDEQKLNNIRKGALLHDVGKIAIPDAILKKPSSLSQKEWIKIRLHPSLGFGLIKEIKLVQEVGDIILYHHERYDGTGYPSRLKQHKIPLEARIFAVADTLDAITSHRPYRAKKSFSFAKKEIQENTGTQFDPEIIEAFSSFPLKKWEKIRFETTKLLPTVEEMIKLTS